MVTFPSKFSTLERLSKSEVNLSEDLHQNYRCILKNSYKNHIVFYKFWFQMHTITLKWLIVEDEKPLIMVNPLSY